MVPIVAILVLLAIGAAVSLGGSGGGDGDTATTKPDGGAVDISDLDDPGTRPPTTTSTSEAPTTSVATGPGERVPVTTDSGISWTMAAEPEQEDIVDPADPSKVIGTAWSAEAGDATTERVELTDLAGEPFDIDAAFAAIAVGFDGELSEIEDSHIATADGLTASFEGTLDSGEPVVGYLVAAQVGDQGLVVATYRADDDLQGLYLDFLALPSTVDLS